VFRHSCVFVNASAGIRSAADLTGRTIGEFGIYGQDSGVWAKGILADEYGFRPEANRWVIGGLEQPAPPFGFTTHPHPSGLEVTTTDRSLSDLLEKGEIDALFTANVPQRFLDGSPAITRLFPDYEAVERDWYRRTGIFPMMHTVAVRRSLLDSHPGLARAVYDTFLAAKEAGAERYRRARRWFGVPVSMLPWTNALDERNAALFPEDWWPYGVDANRSALDTYLRHHHEQGLSARRWSIEEIFTPELLDT
jgi:4,5-dihydroxyphthalate decarboxylase